MPSKSGSCLSTGSQSLPIRSGWAFTGKTSGASTVGPMLLIGRAYAPAASVGLEVRREPRGVPVLPALLRSFRRVLAVELDEGVDEVAANGRGPEQLGQIQEPFGVPGRPVRVLSVADPVDDGEGRLRLGKRPSGSEAHAACGTSRSRAAGSGT